jgi:2-polyprenyl-3-methyl-5-hydroxy-6-metoxy-1,4-benzoquinol methylase
MNETQKTARNLSGDLSIASVNTRDSDPRIPPPPPEFLSDKHELTGFVCLLCGENNGDVTGKHPRDREEANIVVCKSCGLTQMFPLLTPEEEKKEYDNDIAILSTKTRITENTDFDGMRKRWIEWTKVHADMYYPLLQQHTNVLEIASGYGFFMEEINARPDRRFNIDGSDIGEIRLQNFVGGKVYKINFATDEIPRDMLGKYDLIIAMHILEHLSSPVRYLKNLKPLLANNGKLVFEVPNIDCRLGKVSSAYHDWLFLYEHCSYYKADTLRFVFEKAGYKVDNLYTREIYSLENHINWIREGKPCIKYHQMYMPHPSLEDVNEIYKKQVGETGEGYLLIIEAIL